MVAIVVLVTNDVDDGYRSYESIYGVKSFYSSGASCDFGRDYLAGDHDTTEDSFARFASVSVPAGATINSATLKLTANSSNSANFVKIKIFGEKALNPSVVTSYDDYTNRAKTTAYLQNDAVSAWVAGTTYSFDLTAVIAEIIAQAGWASGNAVQIFVMNNVSSAGTAVWRRPKSHETSTSLCAELDITYTVAVAAVPSLLKTPVSTIYISQ